MDVAHELEGPAEEEVADQHARLVAEERLRRLPAAPQVTFIDHIVMQQCGGVDELDASRQGKRPIVLNPDQPGSGKHQKRTQALAAGRDDVLCHLGNQRDGGLHVLEDQSVDPLQVGAYEIQQRLQAGYLKAWRFCLIPCNHYTPLVDCFTTSHAASWHAGTIGRLNLRSSGRDLRVRELLQTNDLVRLSWLQALLNDADIPHVVLDAHASVLEGSALAIRRRLMVDDEDYTRACRLMRDAGESLAHG